MVTLIERFVEDTIRNLHKISAVQPNILIWDFQRSLKANIFWYLLFSLNYTWDNFVEEVFTILQTSDFKKFRKQIAAKSKLIYFHTLLIHAIQANAN